MIHSRIKNSFVCFRAINERLCAADLHIGGNKVRLISVYMPDSSNDDAEVEAIYILIDVLIEEARKLGMSVIIGGDMNAVVGKPRPGEEKIVGPYVQESSKERGDWLKNWASSNTLAITNTFFNQDVPDQWSYRNGDRRWLIDFILTDQGMTNRFTTAEVQDAISIGSDHRSIVATLTLTQPSRKRCKRNKPEPAKAGNLETTASSNAQSLKACVTPKQLDPISG